MYPKDILSGCPESDLEITCTKIIFNKSTLTWSCMSSNFLWSPLSYGGQGSSPKVIMCGDKWNTICSSSKPKNKQNQLNLWVRVLKHTFSCLEQTSFLLSQLLSLLLLIFWFPSLEPLFYSYLYRFSAFFSSWLEYILSYCAMAAAVNIYAFKR